MHKMLKAINSETILTFHIENYCRGSWGALILIPSLKFIPIFNIKFYVTSSDVTQGALRRGGGNPVMAVMEMQLQHLSMAQLSQESW